MHVLDGVFHRDDVTRSAVIESVNDARKRGGLARACRAGDQHKAVLEVGQAHDLLRNVVLDRVRQTKGNDADDRTKRTALTQYVGAETTDARHGKREVVIVVLVPHEEVEVTMRQLVQAADELISVTRLQRG